MLQILGLIALLAAIAPVCMAGGQMIGAFMTRSNIVPWVVLTLLCMCALVGGGLLAVHFTEGNPGQLMQVLGGSASILGPVWAIYFVGARWIERRASQQKASS
jgi:hypothetical protein